MVAAALVRTVTQLGQRVESPADDELLRRFANQRDQAAFAEVVQRHGAMVQGVARRMLCDHHAAEDVLQATFLLLARKAPQVRWRRSVGPWLYAAAVRFARKSAHRRSRHPQSISPVPTVAEDLPPDRPLLWQEVRSVLDEELSRLPEALRAPLVLCYLQGLTRDEAAPQLGWTLATLKRRLEKGRERLRGRLARRGLGLAALAGLLAADSKLSAEATRRVVEPICTGKPAASVVALAGSAFARWQKLLAIALLVAVASGGAWLIALKPARGGQPAQPPAPAAPPAAPAPPAFAGKTDALGDPLPAGAVARLGTTRLRPGKMISAMAYSPDGKQLAIWCRNWGSGNPEQLIFADPTTGRELRSTTLPPNMLLSMRWLADGRGLALTKMGMRNYFLWQFTDSESSLPVLTNPSPTSWAHDDVLSAAISPDGRWLATGRQSTDGKERPIELCEFRPNVPLADLTPKVLGRQIGHCLYLLFSADGKRLFALCRAQDPSVPGPGAVVPGKWAERARIVVYELPDGKELNSFRVAPPTEDLTGGKSPPERVVLSPHGKSLLIGDEKGIVHVYDWAAGKETHAFTAHPDADPKTFERPGVNAMAFSPDGRTLYTASRSNVFAIRDATTGEARSTVRDLMRGSGHFFALSPDGSQLAVADSGVTGRVRVFDAKTGKDRLDLPGHISQVSDLRVLPDGTAVTAGGDGRMRWWELETGRELKSKPINVPMFMRKWSAFMADGTGWLDWHDQKLRHIDLATGRETTIAENVTTPWNSVHGVSRSSVFFSTGDGKVRLWDLKTGNVRQTYDGSGLAVLSRDERRVAIISQSWKTSGNTGYFTGSQISLYDAATGGLRKRYTTDAMLDCAEFTPDGRYFVVGGRPRSSTTGATKDESALPIPVMSGLILLDSVSGEAIRAYEPAVKAANNYYRVPTVAISPNSHLIAAVQHDNSIAVYELASGGVCRMYPGHRSETTRMAFTADGRRLVSVSADMTGLVWDTSYAALAKPSVADRDKLWADLAKPEWALAGPALAALANRPHEFLSLVRDRLPAATGPDFDVETLTKLVAQLGDPVFAARERASATLVRHGREALPLLHDGLSKTTSAEQRRRLQVAIDTIARSPVPSDRLRQVRLLALLEQQKTDAAKAELKRLAAGHAAAALSREAKAIIER